MKTALLDLETNMHPEPTNWFDFAAWAWREQPERPAIPTKSALSKMSSQARQELDIERLNYLRELPPIVTPRITKLHTMILERELHNSSGRSNSCYGVRAEAACGKTTAVDMLLRELHRRHNPGPPQAHIDGETHTSVPVVRITAPSTPKSLYSAILRFLAVPVPKRASAETLMDTVTDSLRQREVRWFFLDDAHCLRDAGNSVRAVGGLKTLLNNIGATPVWTVVDSATGTAFDQDESDQLTGRTVWADWTPYPATTSGEIQEWVDFLLRYCRQLPLSLTAKDWERFVKKHHIYIWKRTQGSPGALAELMTTATTRIILSDASVVDETVTKELLAGVQINELAERRYRALS